ncbi:hypothetical protein TcYC6_0122250 [Trypanosoma cruzi]|nr:hypothetical protein TcYC6_0122250 [Trypanosoma cruzi]
MTFKTQCKLSVSPSKKAREAGAPYKESHSKRFRDRVMDARECLSNDERVLLLVRERNDCKAELREKCEQIKKLEVALRAVRAQLARDATKPGSSVAEQGNSINDLRVTRLVSENNDLEKNLREARAQISTWKRDARVSHLQELKLELAVYQSEVARLYSVLQGGRERDLRKSCVESRLREALDAVETKRRHHSRIKRETFRECRGPKPLFRGCHAVPEYCRAASGRKWGSLQRTTGAKEGIH